MQSQPPFELFANASALTGIGLVGHVQGLLIDSMRDVFGDGQAPIEEGKGYGDSWTFRSTLKPESGTTRTPTHEYEPFTVYSRDNQFRIGGQRWYDAELLTEFISWLETVVRHDLSFDPVDDRD